MKDTFGLISCCHTVVIIIVILCDFFQNCLFAALELDEKDLSTGVCVCVCACSCVYVYVCVCVCVVAYMYT